MNWVSYLFGCKSHAHRDFVVHVDGNMSNGASGLILSCHSWRSGIATNSSCYLLLHMFSFLVILRM